MKGICSICDLLGLVCFLLVTKPLMGYSLLQNSAASRTSNMHLRRNEEQQKIHSKVYTCYVANLDTHIHAQRRSGQHFTGPRTLPMQVFTTHNRFPAKDRVLPLRQGISQLLRPPAPVPRKQNINLIYFTTPTPIPENKYHHQTFRPASPLSSEFKLPILPFNLASPVNSATHKTIIMSTTVSPTISLGSYSSDNQQPHTQKKTHLLSNPGTSNFHASTQNGKYQLSAVINMSKPVNSKQPGSQQRPLPLKPANNDNTKQSLSANTFQPPKTPNRISAQVPSTLAPQVTSDSKQHNNIPQVDNIKREIYHITKPVFENTSDSKPNVASKPEIEQNSSQQKREDLKLSGNELGYIYPGVQTSQVGLHGMTPYGLDFVGLAQHHTPVENSLLINSMWNPAPGLGLGGVENVIPYRYGTHLYGRDPILNLLLKNYGKYLPYGLGSYGLYSYSAPSNIDNSKPFGLYKYEDRI